jgi:hypothetical protein
VIEVIKKSLFIQRFGYSDIDILTRTKILLKSKLQKNREKNGKILKGSCVSLLIGGNAWE